LPVRYIFHIVNVFFMNERKLHMTADRIDDDKVKRARGRPRGWHDKTAQNTVKSLDRAMQVFEFLSDTQGMTLSNLASALDQSPATVYRILVTLEDLGIEQNGHVLFVNQVETHASIRAFFPPGTLSRLHASGIGKALLAQMDQARVDRFIADAPLETFTEYTLSDRDGLIADLKATRARGYSIDGEERNIGMRCIAAPVFDFHAEAIAGVSVSGPTSRVGLDQIDGFSQAVTAAARELTVAIGGQPA